MQADSVVGQGRDFVLRYGPGHGEHVIHKLDAAFVPEFDNRTKLVELCGSVWRSMIAVFRVEYLSLFGGKWIISGTSEIVSRSRVEITR